MRRRAIALLMATASMASGQTGWQRLFTGRDESLSAAGAVGVWSKADSLTEIERMERGPRT